MEIISPKNINITIPDGQTFGSTSVRLVGTITRLVLNLPDLTTDTTAILTITDEDGYEIYNSGAQNDNGSTSLAVEGDIHGQLTFTITCNTAQSGDKSCSVKVTARLASNN